MKCVIIDDNDQDREIIRYCFDRTRPNMQFYEADNGADGCDLVAEIKPDIAIVDLRMPGKDGYATLDCIRQKSANDNIFLVVLTGSDDEDEKRLALSKGAKDFYTKPEDIQGYKKVAQRVICTFN